VLEAIKLPRRACPEPVLAAWPPRKRVGVIRPSIAERADIRNGQAKDLSALSQGAASLGESRRLPGPAVQADLLVGLERMLDICR
jgi:hypothetical protein